LGRELSVQDFAPKYVDGEPFGGRGAESDRNRVLLFSIPDAVADRLAEINSEKPVTSETVLGKLYAN